MLEACAECIVDLLVLRFLDTMFHFQRSVSSFLFDLCSMDQPSLWGAVKRMEKCFRFQKKEHVSGLVDVLAEMKFRVN